MKRFFVVVVILAILAVASPTAAMPLPWPTPTPSPTPTPDAPLIQPEPADLPINGDCAVPSVFPNVVDKFWVDAPGDMPAEDVRFVHLVIEHKNAYQAKIVLEGRPSPWVAMPYAGDWRLSSLTSEDRDCNQPEYLLSLHALHYLMNGESLKLYASEPPSEYFEFLDTVAVWCADECDKLTGACC